MIVRDLIAGRKQKEPKNLRSGEQILGTNVGLLEIDDFGSSAFREDVDQFEVD